MNLFRPSILAAAPPKSRLSCIGGGRISREPGALKIFGYSQAFGKPDHSVAAEMLRAALPGTTVTWSDEGY
jgi:phosphohistidine phosphatase